MVTKRTLLIFSFTNFQKDTIKFTRISICHLVLTLSISKKVNSTYLPTEHRISTLGLPKRGSNNSVHMSTLNKLKAFSEVILYFRNILFQSLEESGSECQVDCLRLRKSKVRAQGRRSFKSATTTLES